MFVFGGLLNLKKGSMVFSPVPSAKVISLITFSASSNTAGIGPFGACGAATDFTLGSHTTLSLSLSLCRAWLTTGCYCWKKSQTTTWLVLETLLIIGIFTIQYIYWFCRIFSRSTVWFNSFRPLPTWLLLRRTHIYPNVKFGWESLALLKCWKIDSFGLSRLLINPGPTLLEKNSSKTTGVLVQLQAKMHTPRHITLETLYSF